MLVTCASCGVDVDVGGPPGTPGKCACGNKLTVPSQPVKEQFGVARCTNCWKRYGVVGRPPGTRFKCKACGQLITIRVPGQKAPPAAGAAAPRKAPKKAVKKRKKGATLTKRRHIDQLAETQDMDAVPLPPSRQRKAPGAGGAAAAGAGRQAAKELAELRASVQKFRAAAEQGAAAAREARGQLEEKEHQLEERTAEVARRAEEIATLQERNSRQAEEISSLQGDLDARSQEIDEIRTRLGELEESVRAREAERDERDEKIRELEKELEGRVTREETEKFRAEKQEVERKLEDGGVKLSAMKETITNLREPLAEALKRFDDLKAEAGSLELPDITEEFRRAKRDAEERGSALVELKKALDEESQARGEKEAEGERLTQELAAAREAHEEFVKAAEAEIEHLASSAAAAEERKGFLKGLFGGKKQQDEVAERARTSRRKLKEAAAKASDSGTHEAVGEGAELKPVLLEHEGVSARAEADEIVDIGEAEPVEEAPPEELEPIDLSALDDAGEAAEDLAEAEEVEEAEEAEEAEEVEEAEDVEEAEEAEEIEEAEEEPPKKKSRRSGKSERKGKRRRRR